MIFDEEIFEEAIFEVGEEAPPPTPPSGGVGRIWGPIERKQATLPISVIERKQSSLPIEVIEAKSVVLPIEITSSKFEIASQDRLFKFIVESAKIEPVLGIRDIKPLEFASKKPKFTVKNRDEHD